MPTANAKAMMLDGEIFGLPIATQEPVFATLATHRIKNTAAVTGAITATAPKRPGRHSRTVCLSTLAGIFGASAVGAVQ
jgi:hypothetical protein